MAKKMVLIDPSHMILKTSPVPDTLSNSVLGIDAEIRHILNNTNMHEHDKAKAYQQALQQYLIKVEQLNNCDGRGNMQGKQQNERVLGNDTPSRLSREDNDSIKTKLERRIIDSVPKLLSKKAEHLLEHIKDNGIVWNERGEIISNGELIPNSNISDLVHETIRDRKRKGDQPKGWATFAKALHASNIPLELVGNKNRWNSTVTSPTTPVTPTTPNTPGFITPDSSPKTPTTPKVNSKKRKAKKKPTQWLDL